MIEFSERLEDVLVNYSLKFLSVTKAHYFEDFTVEPTGIIGKMPAYLMDDTMVDAIRRQVKEHKGRG